MFGHFLTDILATICDDKIVLEVYFLETYCRTPHTFLQVAARSQMQDSDYGIFG